MGTQKKRAIIPKSVSEEKPLNEKKKNDPRAVWILIIWVFLLFGVLLMYWLSGA